MHTWTYTVSIVRHIPWRETSCLPQWAWVLSHQEVKGQRNSKRSGLSCSASMSPIPRVKPSLTERKIKNAFLDSPMCTLASETVCVEVTLESHTPDVYAHPYQHVFIHLLQLSDRKRPVDSELNVVSLKCYGCHWVNCLEWLQSAYHFYVVC